MVTATKRILRKGGTLRIFLGCDVGGERLGIHRKSNHHRPEAESLVKTGHLHLTRFDGMYHWFALTEAGKALLRPIEARYARL